MIAASPRSFRIASTFAALLTLLVTSTFGQTKSKDGSASVEGTVCDSQNHPLSAVTISLQNNNSGQSFITHTDARGHYRFVALPEGTYALRAKISGYSEATKGPILLAQNEATSFVLLLELESATQSPKPATHPIEFSDEPEFTVAGVTDPKNRWPKKLFP
jgi:hypothetical protein